MYKKINDYRKHVYIYTYCILIGLTSFCDAKKRVGNMDNNCDFFSIEMNVLKESACSPIINDNFRGIIITAPDTIGLSEDVPFVVCGTMKLNRRYTFQFEHSKTNELTVVVENISRKQVWSGNLLRPGFQPVRKNPDVTINDIHPEEVATSWFNVDLFRYIPDMPRQPGIYTVYATLGDYTSNSVVVKLEEK